MVITIQWPGIMMFDGGRAFYTEMGHTEESYSDPVYLKHLLGGIEWAIGKLEKYGSMGVWE